MLYLLDWDATCTCTVMILLVLYCAQSLFYSLPSPHYFPALAFPLPPPSLLSPLPLPFLSLLDCSDLYWEHHFTNIPLDTPHLEESDQYLPEYPLPVQVETLLESGKYENVENRVTKDNYKRRMHNLLYLEEYERRKSMSR